jgi:hypothetical protein
MAAGHPSRTLYVVCFAPQQLVQGPDQLGRFVLIVSGQEGKERSLAFEAYLPTIADRSANARPPLVPDHNCRAVRTRLFAGAIGRTIVNDDGLETTVSRQLVKDAADPACFVQGGDRNRNERLAAGGRS